MPTRKSQIDRAIENIDAEIARLEYARVYLIQARDHVSGKKPKPSRPKPVAAKADGE